MICQIHRNYTTGEVERVTTPSGVASTLYNEALKVTKDVEKALNIWATAYTDSFNKKYGDWVEEPNLSQVMEFINIDSKESKLSTTEALSILNTSQLLGVQPEQLYFNLKNTFFNSNNQLVIDADRLRKSGIYTEDEIIDLLQFPSLRAGLIDILSKMKNSFYENTFTSNIDLSDYPLIIKTGEKNKLGKNIIIPPSEVEDYLIKNLKSVEEIDSLDRTDIKDALSTPEAKDYVKSLLDTYQAVPVYTVKSGILDVKLKNDLAVTLLETVTVNEDKISFSEATSFIRGIPQEDWYSRGEEVVSLLKDIEWEAAQIGLDLVGLADSYSFKSKEEVVGFLELIDDFNISTEELTVNEMDILDLASEINEYFDINDSVNSKVIAPNKFKGRDLAVIEGPVDENYVYKVGGFIRLFNDVYERVDPVGDFETVLENVYQAVRNNPELLPKEAFSSFGLTKGSIDFKGIYDLANKDLVKASIRSFAGRKISDIPGEISEDLDISKEVALLKVLHGSLETTRPYKDLSIINKSITGNKEYLVSDFVSDFYKQLLTNKVEETELWNNALKYFQINSNGIDVDVSDEVKEQIKLSLLNNQQLYDALVNYSLISKNDNLDFLRETIDTISFDTIESRRDFAVNYPETVKKADKEYTRISDNTLILNNSHDEFIKLNDGIYELTNYENGVSVYSKLRVITNPQYFVFDVSSPMYEEVDLQDFKEQSPTITHNKKFNINQAKTVEQGITC